MSLASARRIALVAHPSTPAGAIHGIEVSVQWGDRGLLRLDYSLHADLARISIPRELAPGRAADLWKHTCFEAFIAPAGSRDYCELNFAPSRQWAAYRFTDYRRDMSAAPLPEDPEMSLLHAPHCLELRVAVRLPGELSGSGTGARLGLAAVVQEDNGRLSYWALRHPPGRPDFHHQAGFVLELQT